jgi:prolyl oligopeptidase
VPQLRRYRSGALSSGAAREAALQLAHVATSYAAVLFAAGADDPRIAPWQMTKMAARVQAATSSKRPVLLRVDYDAGHGLGSSTAQYEAQLADIWSFSLWQMGDRAFQPELKP